MTSHALYQTRSRRRNDAKFLAFLFYAVAANAFAASPNWSVQWSTTTPASNAFSTIATTNTSQGFLRIVGPSGQSFAAGIVLTISNATGYLSNGVGYATITLPSNDWRTFTSQPAGTSNQWRITITHQ